LSDYDYDLFVIGAGSGGVRAARFSANYGARVAIAEDMFMGGTCVNVGCIPKKLFVYAAHFHDDFADSAAFGWAAEAKGFDWRTLVDNKDYEIKRLNGIYERLLDNSGVEIVHGRATLADAHTVDVAGKQYTAQNILVATGSWPVVPDIPGKEHIVTSTEAFYLEELPKRAIIVGGGYIAVEFAGIFNGLGVETTQLYRGPLFLRGFDQDVRQHLAGEIAKSGIDLKFSTNVASIERIAAGLTVTLEDGLVIETDLIMYATGRAPKVAGIGLEAVGVEQADNGAIVVDDYFKSSVDSIYALGDVVDHLQLTPVALAQGMAIAKTLFRNEPTKVDYEYIATAVFSQPPVGTVGLTEEEARERHGDVAIFRSTFRALKHTLTGRDAQTMMKIIVDKKTDRVLGVHMVGEDAGEILQGIAVALKAGATKAVFDATIGIHPTAAEEFVTMREPVPELVAEAAE
jgi:glutathione reductase (NADPH)